MSAFLLMHSLFSQAFRMMGNSFLESLMETPTDMGPSHAFARFMSLSSLSNDRIVNSEISSLF